jgi:hypothetical protein
LSDRYEDLAKRSRPHYNGCMSWIRAAFKSVGKVACRPRAASAGHPERAVRTRREVEAELEALGWELEAPKQTSAGWKVTIRRGTDSMLVSASTIEEVLDELLRSAKARATEAQEQP